MVRHFDILPLGGLGEIGMNCLCIEHGDTRLIIDTGLTFPDHNLGTEIIHPEFSYVWDNPRAHQAVILTHGHEDHVGSLPHLLAELDVPVYGTPYALATAKERLGETPPPTAPEMIATRPGQRFTVGDFEIEPFRVAHSIPDCTGLIIRSGAGTIVHTADFRIDRNPPDGEVLDEEAMARVGDEGVRLLLSDSTNVERESIDGGEARVGARLQHHVAEAKGRVVVSMFSSNIYRLQALVDAARTTGRKLALLGRSIETHARVASELGALRGLEAVQVDRKVVAELPPNQVLIAATGSQGELRAALQRLARGTHHSLSLGPGDLVIHSARIIPGKEREVYATFDELARRGIRLLHRNDDPDIHVSGHAPREDQRRMLELTRPRAFVPVHGTLHHMTRHMELARAMGVEEHAILENGTRLRVSDDGFTTAGTEVTGLVHMQAGQAVDDIVLRDRGLLAAVGICVIALTVDAEGLPVAEPHVITRGVLCEDDEPDLIAELREAAEDGVRKLKTGAPDEALMQAACRPVRRILRNALGFKPPVHCLLTRLP